MSSATETVDTENGEPLTSVIIVNYNGGPRLTKCLEHLAGQTFTDFEIIVVDNGSTDGSLAQARAVQTAQPLTFVEAGCNLGFAAANNLAACSAKGAWLALLNPDAYAAPGWLANLIAATKRYPFADAFGSTQLDDADPSIIDGAGDVYHALGLMYRGSYGHKLSTLPGDGECFAPCAAAALYRRKTFQALGGFDERFFCYGEDVDFGFRLRLAGGWAVQVRDAVVRHEGSALSGQFSDFTVYHGNRNRIWLAFKNTPGWLYWPLLPFQAGINLCLLGRAVLVGLGPPYWRALRDGYGGLGTLAEDRKYLQAGRRASVSALARSFVWWPWKLIRRAPHLRPVEQADEPGVPDR